MLDLGARATATSEGGPETGPTTAGGGRSPAPTSPAAGWLFRLSVVAALAPVVVATARALDRGWMPIGDNAYFAIRARDVLTEHHPLLGTWTSASLSVGANLNNPGPLLFDLLAAPAKLIGGGAGVAVGAAALNALAVVGVAVVARRLGGVVAGTVAMAVTATLLWAMGSELLFDPWQPHSLLVTFLLFAVLVWALAAGDVVALPFSVGVASLLVQTHLSYAVLVAALAAWGVLGCTLARRRVAREDTTAHPGRARTTRLAVVAAVMVAGACWAQPLVEQVTGEGEGNLTRVAANAGTSSETLGPALGTRLVADVVASPPFWLPPSFEEGFLPAVDPVGPRLAGVRLPALPSAASSLLALTGGGVVLLVCWALARRRGDRVVAAGAVTAAVGLGAGLATAVSLPVGVIGIAPHQLRWLWPLAAFATLVLLVTVARLITGARGWGRGDGWTGGVVAVALVATLAAAVANVPTRNVGAGPAGDADAMPTVRRLTEGMVALEGEGPLLLDMRGIRFAEPYSGPVMAELQRRDIPFVVDDEGMVRQLGPSRRADPGTERLLIREGDAALATPPGWRRAVLVEGLDDSERAELAELAGAVLSRLEAIGRAPLNEEGEAALAAGALPVAGARPEVLATDLPALLATRELSLLVERGWLDLDDDDGRPFARYAELQERFDRLTVALFVAPPEGG